MDGTIRTIIRGWMERRLPETLPRECDLHPYLDMRPNKIIAVTGFRRVGKTYLLHRAIGEVLAKEGEGSAVFINFDDERIPRKTEFLSKLLPAVRRELGDDVKYLFLDEIQNMPDWSKWLRRVHDEGDLRLFITGSSSQVSSREIPTELRGRCIEVNLFPLSFREYLTFRRWKGDASIRSLEHTERALPRLKRMLDDHLHYGGMPEIVLGSKDRRVEVLQQYYRTVVHRDIVERFRIENEEGLRAMMRLLLNSTQYTVSKLHNTLRSLDHDIGKNTLIRYISHIESSYFMHSLTILSPKVKDRMMHPRKVYFIDNGFIDALSTEFSSHFGRLFENLVAIELLRRGSRMDKDLFYWRDAKGREVDFVITDGLRVQQMIQTCSDPTDPNTRKREMFALAKAARELKCRELSVITDDYDAVETFDGKRMKFIPLWKWLLK